MRQPAGGVGLGAHIWFCPQNPGEWQATLTAILEVMANGVRQQLLHQNQGWPDLDVEPFWNRYFNFQDPRSCPICGRTRPGWPIPEGLDTPYGGHTTREGMYYPGYVCSWECYWVSILLHTREQGRW